MAAVKRHGRVRRWVVRPVFWCLAILAILALLSAMVLESAFLEELTRAFLEERLARALERSVTVEGVEIEPLPLSIELRGLEIGSSVAGEEPFVRIERALVEARSVRWRARQLKLGRVFVQEPTVRLTFREDGTDNLPRRSGRGGRAAPLPLSLTVGEFTILDGTLLIDQQRLPLSLEGRGLRANLLGGRGLDLAGRLDVHDLAVTLPRAQPFLGAVSLRIKVEEDRIQIVSGRLSGPRLAADLGGQWLWRGDKVFELDLDARAEASLFDALGYTRGQLSGPFRFVGGFAWRPRLWGYRGTLTADEIEVFDRRLEDLAAEVAGDRNGVRADVSQSTYGGGSLTGEVTYSVTADGQPFDLRLQAAGVSLARILADQKIPLDGVDGEVTGPFHYSFPVREPQRGSGRAELEIRAGTPSAEAIELSGRARLKFDRGILETEAIQVVSDSQHALVSGLYDIPERTGRFDLEIGTEDVAEVLRLLPLSPEALEGATWAPRTGAGRIEGSLAVTGTGTYSEVRLDLDDVVAPGYRAEEVRGTFRVGASGLEDLRIELMRTNGAVIVSGSVPFQPEAGPPSEVPFALGVEAAGWPSSDAQAWLPIELPLDGQLYGSLTLAGDPSAPIGTLVGRLEPATISDIEVDRLGLELEFDPGEIRFAQVEAETAAGLASLSGSIELGSGALRLRLESEGLELERPPLAERVFGASGRLALAAEITGDWDRPRVSGELAWSRFSFGGAAFRDSALTRVDWDGERLQLSGSIPWLSEIEGGGRLDRDGFDVRAELSTDDLSGLLEALPSDVTGIESGSLRGALVARGSFSQGPPVELELRLDQLALERDSVALKAAEPVVVRLNSEALDVDSLFLTTEDGLSELFVAGRVLMDETRTLDLFAQSSLASEWLEPFLPGFVPRGGRFEVLASIGGTLDLPRLNGVGELRDSTVLFDAISVALQGLQGLVLFYPDRLVLDSVRADAAGGALEAGGSVVLAGTDRPASYHLDFIGRGLRFSYPEGWLLRGDARASLVSTETGRLLRGEVELERAYYLDPIKVGFESALQALFQRQRTAVRDASELLSTTSLNLRIEGTDALRVRNNLADLEGDVDFTLRGTLADPVLFGAVELTPGGTLVYAGNEYEIQRGSLNFANPYRIEPIVDLVAVTDLREYDVRLNLSGSPDRLDVGVSSDPPLPDLEVLALLTGSRSTSRSSLGRQQDASAGLGVEGFLAGEAASVVTNRVNRLFGLDRLRVSPLTGSTGDLSSARVTLGERISRDLFATYSYDPSTTEEQILELEWSVSPSLVVVLTQNGDESYSVDLRWEKAF